MAEVYRYGEKLLGYFTQGVKYLGFEDHDLSCVERDPVTIYDQELQPGDKITGFDSGKNRSSFMLESGYMTYVGKIGSDLLFEVYDPEAKPRQGDLFHERPLWLLAFGYISNFGGLFSYSGPGTGYDLQPRKIHRWKQ